MNLLCNPEEFSRWWDHPGTLAFRDYLKERRSDLMEAWAAGNPLAPEIQAQAVVMGQLAGLSAETVAFELGIEVKNDDAVSE